MSVDWNWPGARWWKFDLHAHTPASDDYGKGPDQVALKQRTPKEWLLDYMRAGIDCVAVTDHNSGAWIDLLRNELHRLRNESPPGYRPLWLFPGAEITVHGGIHILALFGPGSTASDIDSLLGAVHFPSDKKGGSEDCTQKSATEVVDEIVGAKAIAIPAHVDEARGLFGLPGTTLQQVLKCREMVAMEVCNASAAKPQLFASEKVTWTEALGSDAHHPTGPKSPGSHFTWVKMGEPTLEGLRLALLDGPLSIKRSDQFSGAPNVHGHLAIESLTVKKARYLGREDKPFECRLNPWLNSIIGGRGTGKSTLLEFTRLTMRRQDEIPEGLREDLKKYQEAYESRKDEGLLTEETQLVVTYRKDNARFRVQWSHDGHVEPILAEDSDGSWQPAQGDVSQRFPLRIYSQKQVFELARQPRALLRIIDDAAEIKHREWQERWDQLESGFLALRAKIREIEAGLAEEPRLRGELDDVQRKLKVFEQAGHADVLKAFQRRRRQLRGIEQWEEGWAGHGDRIRDLASQLSPADLDVSLFDSAEKSDAKCLVDVNAVREQLDGICDKLRAIAIEADEVAVSWKQTREQSVWLSTIKDALDKYEQLRVQLERAGAGDPSEFGRLVQQRQALEERFKDFGSRREALKGLEKKARQSLQQLRDHRRELTRRRAAFVKSVLSGNSYVSIQVLPYDSRESVEDEFRELINRGQGGFEKDIGKPDSEEGLLSSLYRGYMPTSPRGPEEFEQRLERLRGYLRSVRQGDGSSVRDSRFATYIRNLAPENLDRLDCWFPEDSLEVSYSVGKGGEFKPVRQGSPGQKTAALLAFLLSYGEEPLVLDQPEDDLDNHLIYELIVTQLRESKQKRQVVVVTHNANIVVNGDAELVIALDVRDGQTHKVCEGCLQEAHVRDEICRVMEGGSEAFELRYRRIRSGATHV
ncbi:MAG: ABC transporter [Planctomycetes bacterium]|nr:ABC transporter [Planctomycetota bacterium]